MLRCRVDPPPWPGDLDMVPLNLPPSLRARLIVFCSRGSSRGASSGLVVRADVVDTQVWEFSLRFM